MKKRRPYIQLFPADLRSDQALRLCSRAARSFWTDLFGLMHFAEPRGYLLVSGRAPTYAELAKILGDSEAEVGAFIEELERNGVFSRTGAEHELGGGVIYSRRMVREAEKAAVDAENGALGGNPDLKAVNDANATAALSAEEKKIAARERTRRYRERKKGERVTSQRHAGDAPCHVTVTGDKRDGGEKNLSGRAACADVTGVNPQNPSSNSNSSSLTEKAEPQPSEAPTEQSAPSLPLKGGGRAAKRAEQKAQIAEAKRMLAESAIGNVRRNDDDEARP